MMNKKEKKDLRKENLQSPRGAFSPFTNLRKSFRRLKQKRVNRVLSADSVTTNKASCTTEQVGDNISLKCKEVNTRDTSEKGVLKRIAFKKRFSLNDPKIINHHFVGDNRLSVIEWSSCESLTDYNKVRQTKSDSLRRSRASLVIPNDVNIHRNFVYPMRISRYDSLNLIDNSKGTSEKKSKWHSSEGILDKNEEEISHLKEGNDNEYISAPKRKRLGHKKVGHSLSLPNICEKNSEVICEIDIDFEDSHNDAKKFDAECRKSKSLGNNSFTTSEESSMKLIKRTNANLKNENTIEKNMLETSTQGEGQCSSRLSTQHMFSSTPALDRPPLPSAPKPVDRRDKMLKWASSEVISPRKARKTERNDKEKFNRTLSDSKITDITSCEMSMESQLLQRRDLDKAKHSKKQATSEVSLMLKNEEILRKSLFNCKLPLAIAESLWDHTGLNDDELTFSSGNVIIVLFKEDDHWWWGSCEKREGWFPASYVHLRVVQELDEEFVNNNEVLANVSPKDEVTKKSSKEKLNTLRAKCVEELLNTEKDYVKLLRNIIEGYLQKVREDQTIFSTDDATVIFGNIEELYNFHKSFSQELQAVVQLDHMEESLVGNVFLKHKTQFEIYSKYCNEQPRSSARLSSLNKDKKYKMFFEACRLRQNMIRLSLDGFLLSPVQRICKYPLQLKELLKHTSVDHPDYESLIDARNCMQNVASMINERKRRLENVNKLAKWQLTVSNWKGDNVVQKSSDLLHKGVLNKITNTKDVERVAFLFDHQIIYFRRDFTKRLPLTYNGRIDLDSAIIEDIVDGEFTIGGEPFTNGWKIWNSEKKKWCYFYTNCNKTKEAWLKALQDERKHVEDEIQKGFTVLQEVREAAILHAYNKHIAGLKKNRMRRKSISTSHADLDTTDTFSLKPKYDSLQIDESQTPVTKRLNKPRRNRSFRLSLQGSIFDKYL